MRKGAQMVLAVLLVAVASLFAWRVWRSRKPEPMYQGKLLSVWLCEYRNRGDVDSASHAVQQIGTNAIPTLLEMLCKRDSNLGPELIRLWNQNLWRMRFLPRWARRYYVCDYKIENRDTFINHAAAGGFEILG